MIIKRIICEYGFPNWFLSLEDAKEKLIAWQNEYNTERPHSALGYRTLLEGRTKTINDNAVAA
jgi:transposase InsO family protein